MRIRKPSDLIRVLHERSPLAAVRRALVHGQVEMLGGFREVPPDAQPGWIVRITSEHGRVWIIGVVPDEVRHRLSLRSLSRIPWEYWDGNGDPLYDGDEPHDARKRREEAMEEGPPAGLG